MAHVFSHAASLQARFSCKAYETVARLIFRLCLCADIRWRAAQLRLSRLTAVFKQLNTYPESWDVPEVCVRTNASSRTEFDPGSCGGCWVGPARTRI